VRAACGDCLRRSWLVAELADHIDRARDRFGSLDSLLALDDEELTAALAGRDRGRIRAARAHFDPELAQAGARHAGLAATCRHDSAYPRALLDMPDPPAVLHVAGDAGRARELWSAPAVALVGARRASPYGLEVARSLGRGLAAAGVTVVSGMALGIDCAAHEGALEGGGATLAVLGGGADVPYPASKRGVHRRLVATGAVLSELPAGVRPRRWCFPARNRLIAALTAATVVVEAAERSGALITARMARELGRDVAAVPGPVNSPRSAGANALLFDGAHLIRDPRDVLELLFGAGGAPAAPERRSPAGLDADLRDVLERVAGGQDTATALARTPAEVGDTLVALSELELTGWLRRGGDGRYLVVSAAKPA
jgi:DNA processing protein